jgi:hypothetical protein
MGRAQSSFGGMWCHNPFIALAVGGPGGHSPQMLKRKDYTGAKRVFPSETVGSGIVPVPTSGAWRADFEE